jgi:glycosyltransferase involved in cell wall biosynthesis
VRVLAIQGSRSGKSAFALVNARWSDALSASGEYTVVEYDAAAPPPDLFLHHDFESHFTTFQPPSNVPSVAVRTWDFGPLPRAWVERINGEYQQYWAHTSWIAQQARTAGVNPDLIRVVPHGVDPSEFTPEGPRYELPSKEKFAFLFVGGASFRKGTDILVSAWRKAFSASDDVVLVVKDHSGDLFYRDNNVRDSLTALKRDPDAAEVVHIDSFLPRQDLAALYRTCDVAVFPYRAEGFCTPILESMASGTPPIVPRFGACLDYCSEDNSYFVDSRRIQVPVHRRLSVAMGFTDDVDEVDFCEVRIDALAERLQQARSEPARDRNGRAEAGVRVAHEQFTWDNAFVTVRRCLAELPHRNSTPA